MFFQKYMTLTPSKNFMVQQIPGTVSKSVHNAQWESARPNLDLPKIEARSEASA